MSSMINRIANYQKSFTTKKTFRKSLVGIVQCRSTEDLQ